MPPTDANISRHLALMAARQPGTPALKIPRGRTRAGDIDYLALTFAELDAEAAAWHARLAARGVRPGDRALVMVRPGLPLIAATFALFRLGAVPVIIDPGMGLKSFLACVARSRPRTLVGIPMAQILSRVFWKKFSTVAVRVPVSGSLTAKSENPKSKFQIPNSGSIPHSALRTPHFTAAPSDLAAVLFTSGSTGAPKGVCYEHGMFDAQVRLIRDTYAIAPGEIDLPLLPIFALFNPALGMTTIVPELDPRRPAEIDPAKIVQAIQQENVTNSFGSPTLWKKIGDHCLAQKITLPTLRRVLCAGAPVPAALWESSRAWIPNGQLHSPYGATEALPIATISADEIARINAQHPTSNIQLSSPPSPGLTPSVTPSVSAPVNVERSMLNVERFAPRAAPVGRPLPEITVKIIALTDAHLATLADTRELPPGEIGEIIVSGPVVTKEYDALPAATTLAKIENRESLSRPLAADISQIQNSTSSPWHRMGDCGYLDAQGRLWFCGRKAERVETATGTLHTEPCERVFRVHPRAARCALIALGERPAQRPALVVETATADARDRRALARELRLLARAHPQTASIQTFFFRPKFPVDVRHNAKIHRLTLARWATTAKGYASDPKK